MSNREIVNPFAGLEGYNCFGCSPHNPIGLQLEFHEEGDWLSASWTPTRDHEGWHDVLHGGIQTTLLDELGSWLVFVKVGTAGVTSKIEIKFLKAVQIHHGAVTIRGHILESRRNIHIIEAFLYDGTGTLCAEALMHYFAFSTQKARELMLFPDPDSFFKKQE